MKLLVSNPICWKLCLLFIRFGNRFSFLHNQLEHAAAEERLQELYNKKTVQRGFFKGLRYPNFTSFGSSIFPKFSGSYEMELHPVFESFKYKDYKQIIDIGCAEGFYAVGLAIAFPKSVIYAYDIDEKALELCRHLAEFNDVSNRMVLNGICTSATIKQFNFTGSTLLICDCEGYEKNLFNSENCKQLLNADIIIELHPFIVKGVKEYLIGLFEITHDIEIISSYDNNRKMADLQLFLIGLNKLEQLKSVEEGRPCTMDWLIARSKNQIKI